MAATSGGGGAGGAGGGGGGGGNIKVVVRVRPFNSRELERRSKCIVEMKDKQTVLTPAPDPKSKSNKAVMEGTKTFAFDKSYWSFNREDSHFAGQDDVFADLGLPLLDNAFQGYNNCIFAYGQTGSGKSYSMMGYGTEEGVIPKICRDMFERIGQIQQDPNLTCTVEVSYLEIYNERVRDLLNPSTKGNLKVREHPSTGPYVEDLAKLVVRSFSEIENLMDEGNKARTVAATNMNETSSRSHAVFTLTLTQRRHDTETNMDSEKVAKISLVDLAGSERATSTGATGARLKEGAEINRSLSTLGRVIAALADLSTGKKRAGSMVPYRDSVLTWLLKDSLGGNSLTAMIAAISPADINFEETLSTLRYADSAKRIKNHAVVNEDPNARMIRELKEELAQLRSKLGGGGGGEGGIVQEQYPAGTPLDQQFVSIAQADGSMKKVSKAEIAEQLSQSEKLYQDLNQTWEQKLQKTEQVHKEREAALEELGISIEKGFVGLSTPKRMPHLVNLSDDPLLAECLVYNLKPGTTTVGNVDTAQSADIRLNGSKILHDHCTFENVDGVVTVVPKDNAPVMVNGIRIEQPKRLRSGYRVILGDFHIFRFNHPQEARAERAEEGSRLKHSFAADEMDSPSVRPGHGRTLSSISRAESEADRDRSMNASPIPYRGNARESDWSFARKEAISAVLGADHKISTLTDDELETLFEDLQRVRAGRRGRPESRLFEGPGDDETDSVNSYPTRDKYLSSGTLDNFSMDTALTMPSTPQHDEEEKLKSAREGIQTSLDERKSTNIQRPNDLEVSNVEIEQIRAEKLEIENSLKSMREEMQRQLQAQKEEHEKVIAQYSREAAERSARPLGLSHDGLALIKQLCERWRQRCYVGMAAAVLQNAAELKEAQIMSHRMDKNVVFQFAIADSGHSFGSTYDLVLNDFSSEDDPHLSDSRKPATVVRVIDFRHTIAHLWSVEKLHARVKAMRQMYQYLDKPEYLQHFKLDNPFSESCLPEYTRIGDADIPLAAVFECKVQDFTLDVYSPFTFTVIGIVRLSLEPSSAEAPSSTLKFNVVMHDFAGFPEREGTNVHAQLFFPGISSEEDGATTTQMVTGFDEDTIKFESIHSMSISTESPLDSTLRISFFSKVSAMHLDKLLSWDDMRDAVRTPQRKKKRSRLGEHEFHGEERYDMFSRVQIQEIGEDGTYQPVDVVQDNSMDRGAYQLHQGLQRRLVIEMTSTSGAQVPWTGVSEARVGRLQLVDGGGKVTDMNNEQGTVALRLVEDPVIRTNRDYTTSMKLVAQWDSGAHGSLLLNRPTAEGLRVKMTLTWEMQSVKLTESITMAAELAVQMRPRSYVRQQSMLSQLWSSQRIVHSTNAVFTLTVKPSASRKAEDLWRLSTRDTYVKGEEALESWAPRGVSLIRDYLDMLKRRQHAAAVDPYRRIFERETFLGDDASQARVDRSQEDLTPEQRQLLTRVIRLWTAYPDVSTRILSSANTDTPPQAPTRLKPDDGSYTPPVHLLATVTAVPKNPTLLKAGYLLTPTSDSQRWERRYVELRVPYLHVFSTTTGDQISAINLTNSRVDAEPTIARMLSEGSRAAVFAIYGRTKSWIFGARDARERGEWIWAVDRCYFEERGEGSVTGSGRSTGYTTEEERE
ncbi:Kinesin-like protein unc-104 [Sphaceloma murrayae]|uniref:Kinesin-like protein unc-104 n=1 Tax=Sphaceloma murrayae TaxID=2082308 RepID=A0A2K1QSX8_9PEZI|nr:Kinesin-like protein unc-104 [Sphaceloma murrayae]